MSLIPAILAICLAGCASAWPTPTPAVLRPGPVVIFFGGLAEPEDGNGMASVCARAQAARPDMTIVRLGWWQDADIVSQAGGRPVVLVGHSWGGARATTTAGMMALAGRRVALLVLYEPVPWHGGLLNVVDFWLPDNVQHWLCVYRHAWLPPWSCPVRWARGGWTSEIDHESAVAGQVDINLRLRFPGGHSSLSRHPDVQALLVDAIVGVY
jgi:pimeloyl-ACP methyl ester carboxylesterase